MPRKLFTGYRIECRPIVEPDGTPGYHFRAEGEYTALLELGGYRWWCRRGDWVGVDDRVSRRGGHLTPGKPAFGGRSSRDGAGSPPHEPEGRPPVGEVSLDGDLEPVPLVERHVPRLLSEQLTLDAVPVDAREPRSQQQASQA